MEWTADPLSRFGGFAALNPSNESFPSALSPNGTADWSLVIASGGSVPVSFPSVSWDALRSVYGWTALQFQAWARGELVLCSEATVALYISGAAAEFSIAGTKHVGGDYYEFRRAPLVVTLPAGRHAIDVRVAHDIRAFGGVDTVKFKVEAVAVKGGVSLGEGVVVPDAVGGRLVSEWVSVPVRNDDANWIRVVGVRGKSVSASSSSTGGLNQISLKNSTSVAAFEPVKLAPGQSRPIKFRVTDIEANTTTLEFVLRCRQESKIEDFEVLVTKGLNLIEHWYQPHKYTFVPNFS